MQGMLFHNDQMMHLLIVLCLSRQPYSAYASLIWTIKYMLSYKNTQCPHAKAHIHTNSDSAAMIY